VTADGDAEAEAQTPDVAYPPNSIAVLPFINMSDDEANEYFSDGISEELLNLLVRVPELRVTSRTSAFSLKGKDINAREIARDLNVAHFLEGSVRKDGDRVRITAQLIDARTDHHLWSATYDRTLDDIFAIQDEIAGAVVGELKVALLGSAPTIRKTVPEAYSLFLQARRLGTRFSSEAFEQSNSLYKKALEIDPGYAAAWSGLAMNYINQTLLSFRFMDEGIGLAREAADRALALDPEMALAYAQLSGIALRFDLDLDAAARYMERALLLEPTSPDILRQAAVLCSSLGRPDEAISLNRYVVGRDPINPVSHYYLGLSYLWAGRLDEAVSSFRTAMMLNPDHASTHYRIGTAMYLKGDFEAALKEMLQERGVTKRLMGEAMMRYALGDTDASDAVLAQLIAKHEKTTAYNIAYLKAFRGEADSAFEWLDRAVQYHDTGLPQIPYQPEFDRIRDDARWLPFLESIGMAPHQLASIEFDVTLPE
jgi:TolB-like protein/Tfp pilus assembly protein PilF